MEAPSWLTATEQTSVDVSICKMHDIINSIQLYISLQIYTFLLTLSRKKKQKVTKPFRKGHRPAPIPTFRSVKPETSANILPNVPKHSLFHDAGFVSHTVKYVSHTVVFVSHSVGQRKCRYS